MQPNFPGSAERKPEHNARVLYRTNFRTPVVERFFATHAEAYRAKRSFQHHTWRAVQTDWWDEKIGMWVG